MRFKEPEKLSGFFWVVNKPDKRIPGVLSISDGGGIELEIIGKHPTICPHLRSIFIRNLSQITHQQHD